MAGDTLIERWEGDENPVGTSPARSRDPLAWAALVPTNMNGDVPEDVRKAERGIVLEWIEAQLRPTNAATPYILAYMDYIGQGHPPRADLVPSIDLAEFLPVGKPSI